MRYGLLADIHESVEWLEAAINYFARERVERFIVLGDIFETGHRLEETVKLLAKVCAVGVWGNHDFGLSHEPSGEVRARFSSGCVKFMTSLKADLEFENCLVTHIEPYRDPFDLFELWSFEDDSELHRCFSARPNRLMFHGHHHRWKVTTERGRMNWPGQSTLRFDPCIRYLVQVAAVVDGRCGLLDTAANTLVPIQLHQRDLIRD